MSRNSPRRLASSALDHAALLECLQICERDPEFREQHEGDDWRDRAESACHHLQYRSLLRPWETPPWLTDVDGDDPREADARTLLRRMFAGGISRYEPDPARALKKRRNRKK